MYSNLIPNLFFSQDQLESISNRLFREADENEDGHMTFEEFYEAISEIEIEKKMAFVSFSWKCAISKIESYEIYEKLSM